MASQRFRAIPRAALLSPQDAGKKTDYTMSPSRSEFGRSRLADLLHQQGDQYER